MSNLWQINTVPNPASGGRKFTVTDQQAATLDKVCEYLKKEGQLERPEYLAESEAPASVSVSADGMWAGRHGALLTWHDDTQSLWRTWILPDGSVGPVEQDVIDMNSDDPCEIESHWEPRRATMARLRREAGMKPRPFM